MDGLLAFLVASGALALVGTALRGILRPISWAIFAAALLTYGSAKLPNWLQALQEQPTPSPIATTEPSPTLTVEPLPSATITTEPSATITTEPSATITTEPSVESPVPEASPTPASDGSIVPAEAKIGLRSAIAVLSNVPTELAQASANNLPSPSPPPPPTPTERAIPPEPAPSPVADSGTVSNAPPEEPITGLW